MDKLGCSIFAFDPTVEYPPKRGNRIAFNKLGIAGGISNSKFKTESLKNILMMNNHTHSTVNYLKVPYSPA